MSLRLPSTRSQRRQYSILPGQDSSTNQVRKQLHSQDTLAVHAVNPRSTAVEVDAFFLPSPAFFAGPRSTGAGYQQNQRQRLMKTVVDEKNGIPMSRATTATTASTTSTIVTKTASMINAISKVVPSPAHGHVPPYPVGWSYGNGANDGTGENMSPSRKLEIQQYQLQLSLARMGSLDGVIRETAGAVAPAGDADSDGGETDGFGVQVKCSSGSFSGKRGGGGRWRRSKVSSYTWSARVKRRVRELVGRK